MSHKQYKGFEPKWVKTPAPANSYRSIFRWGDPKFFKFPKESLYKMMKEVFKLTDDDFKEYSVHAQRRIWKHWKKRLEFRKILFCL